MVRLRAHVQGSNQATALEILARNGPQRGGLGPLTAGSVGVRAPKEPRGSHEGASAL